VERLPYIYDLAERGLRARQRVLHDRKIFPVDYRTLQEFLKAPAEVIELFSKAIEKAIEAGLVNRHRRGSHGPEEPDLAASIGDAERCPSPT